MHFRCCPFGAWEVGPVVLGRRLDAPVGIQVLPMEECIARLSEIEWTGLCRVVGNAPIILAWGVNRAWHGFPSMVSG